MTSFALNKRQTLLPSIFDDFFKPWKEWDRDIYGDTAFNVLTVPFVNVIEEKNSYKLSLAAPGLKKEDFKIDVEGNILTISAEVEDEKKEKDNTYSRREYNYSNFSRSFNMPESINKDKIEAHYDEGILKLKLPKNESAKENGKTIQIAVN
jgi:HSP20 family protein